MQRHMRPGGWAFPAPMHARPDEYAYPNQSMPVPLGPHLPYRYDDLTFNPVTDTLTGSDSKSFF